MTLKDNNQYLWHVTEVNTGDDSLMQFDELCALDAIKDYAKDSMTLYNNPEALDMLEQITSIRQLIKFLHTHHIIVDKYKICANKVVWTHS